jgi:hypothetical protein
MIYDFSQVNLEIININTNATPVIYVNQNGITFSRRVLEDLNFPGYVQFCLDTEHRVFAIRACKGTEAKATPFSKPRAEQKTTLNCLNKNIHDTVACLIPDYNVKKRYRVEGHMDTENKVIYYDMTEASESSYRQRKTESLSEQKNEGMNEDEQI